MIYYVSNYTNRAIGAVWGDSPESLNSLTLTPTDCRAIFLDDEQYAHVMSNMGNYIFIDDVPSYLEAEPGEPVVMPPTLQERIDTLEQHLVNKDAELELQNQRFIQLSEDLSGFLDYFFTLNIPDPTE